MSNQPDSDNKETQVETSSCCHSNEHQETKRFDWLLWGSLAIVGPLFCLAIWMPSWLKNMSWLKTMAGTTYDMFSAMWWGVLIGFVFVGVLSKVPRDFIMAILGQGGTISGLLRATGAGVMLDLCSHGILMIGARLYERGASAGQVIAFLLSSPWNSLSLTLILIGLIGLGWTLSFIALSMVIALITGWLFDRLVDSNVLPRNPNTLPNEHKQPFKFWQEARTRLKKTQFNTALFKEMFFSALHDAKMIVRWLLFGILLAAILRAVFDANQFENYFGATLLGLLVTIFVATVLETCSEGSAPIAADILTRANAPGNSFAFLMSGVATDYTEIMIMKQTTKSWRIALFIPLITVPQVVLVAWTINQFTS